MCTNSSFHSVITVRHAQKGKTVTEYGTACDTVVTEYRSCSDTTAVEVVQAAVFQQQ